MQIHHFQEELKQISRSKNNKKIEKRTDIEISVKEKTLIKYHHKVNKKKVKINLVYTKNRYSILKKKLPS